MRLVISGIACHPHILQDLCTHELGVLQMYVRNASLGFWVNIRVGLAVKIEENVYTRWHPTPVLLPGKSHGQRSLVGCGPWGSKEPDTTERLLFHFSLSCIGEGNGAHSNVLAWRIPGTGEPGGLPSMGSHRVGHDWSDLAAAAVSLKEKTMVWKTAHIYSQRKKSLNWYTVLVQCKFWCQNLN